ncbi:hypothetical protein [Nocardiopsis alba]|uniref:hypothetical protein n=1 Tax=Nocardiopsis alba TaxID=53437 RepID=UPI0033A96A3E
MRLLQNLARKLLNRPEPPPNRAHPVGAAQVTISPDTSKLIRTAHPTLSHLHHLHRPHEERGERSPYTICFECSQLWPCSTRRTLDTAATLSDCPHCDPDHRTPWSGLWGAFIPTERDGDGQPTAIHVMRPDGAHIAERDATWVRDVLHAAAEEHHRPLEHLPADEASDRVRADASRATSTLLALDLHQALGLPYDPTSDHQGHEDHPTWWADLLDQVRERTASERPATPELAATTPGVPWASTVYARTFNAVTAASQGCFLPLSTREHITRQVLDELADDLIDDDQAPEPGHVTFQVGKSNYTRCPACEQDDARFQITSYILDEHGQSHPVGRTDVCRHCMHSPFTNTGQENPS